MGCFGSKDFITIAPDPSSLPKQGQAVKEEVIVMSKEDTGCFEDLATVLKENDHLISPRFRQNAIFDAAGPSDEKAILHSNSSGKTLETVQQIRMSLKSNPVFQYNMDEVQILHIIDVMSKYVYPSGTVFTNAGKPNHSLYCLESGLVEMRGFKDDGTPLLVHVCPGQSFGEVFIFDNPCVFTSRALECCTIWILDRRSFKKALISSEKEKLKKRVAFLRTVPLFDTFTTTQYSLVAESGQTFYYHDKEVIVRAGDPVNSNSFFYIIMEGKVEVKVPPIGNYFEQFGYKEDPKREICISMVPGQVIGERALFLNEPRNQTITADGEVRLLGFNKETLSANVLVTLIAKFRDMYSQYEQTVLTEIPLISMLSPEDQQKLCSKAELVNFISEEVIIPMGKIPEYAYIIMEGEVLQRTQLEKSESKEMELTMEDNQGLKKSVLHLSSHHSTLESYFDNPSSLLRNGDFFGYKCIIENKPAEFNFIASENVCCVRLSQAAVQEFIVTKLNDNKMNRAVHDMMVREHHASTVQSKDVVQLKDLTPIQILGKGSYGTVFLCSNENGMEVAVKTINKNSLITKTGAGLRASSCMKIMREMEILRSLPQSLFFVRLYSTAADQENLYFVMEYVKGCELFNLMYDSKGQNHVMKEPVVKFFIANIIVMLNSLHNEKIVYRDLKPENIMFDSQTGYLKLIDFGFSKHVLNRTFTLCGTPLYTAPEVLSCSGHGLTADWWSLGVICYEMLCGYTPFRGKKCYNTFTNILKKEPYLSDRVLTPEAISLISGFLNKKQNDRLGSGQRGYYTVMNHEWFKDLDWEALMNQTMAPLVHYDISEAKEANPKPLPRFGEQKAAWLIGSPLEKFAK